MPDHEGSYLSKDEEGNLKLVNTHTYYYQVQTQLIVTNYDYCDLFIMLPNDSTCMRIEPDKELFQIIVYD